MFVFSWYGNKKETCPYWLVSDILRLFSHQQIIMLTIRQRMFQNTAFSCNTGVDECLPNNSSIWRLEAYSSLPNFTLNRPGFVVDTCRISAGLVTYRFHAWNTICVVSIFMPMVSDATVCEDFRNAEKNMKVKLCIHSFELKSSNLSWQNNITYKALKKEWYLAFSDQPISSIQFWSNWVLFLRKKVESAPESVDFDAFKTQLSVILV